MNLLKRTFRRRGPLEVTLYGKPGCHLCDDAARLLYRLARQYSVKIREVDIRSDPALFRRFDIRIPVMVIDGGAEIEAPIAEAQLRKALRSARRSL